MRRKLFALLPSSCLACNQLKKFICRAGKNERVLMMDRCLFMCISSRAVATGVCVGSV